ncbi:MAG: helix-turn-helix domain-containing protein [Bacteroidetes bacterium]|nr:helix-turn-helix domain-containing protein [Bacteroidota bacterium]
MKETASNEIGSRIKELIFKMNLNQTSFAKSVGVSQNAIFKTITGETMPRLTLIDSILRTYPNVRKSWLLDGEGEMFVNVAPAPIEVKADKYLQEYLRLLEEKFEKLLSQKDSVISDQRYMIEMLKGQLGKYKCAIATGVKREHPATAELREEKVLAPAA